jgi:transposase
MGLGRRKDERQSELFVPHDRLPRSEGHAFYRQLNKLLAEAGFDRFVEALCAPHYQPSGTPGRPSIPPGVYFRMLLVGYFEGIGSQRGIAWRCHDSLSLREFLGVPLTEDAPDHSSLTRVRDRLPLEVHAAAFQFVLKLADEKGLLKGKTVGVDSTTLEANAAMKSIVRKDTGDDWRCYVVGLMKEQGVVEADAEPTDEEVRRFDKGRKNKKVSNEDWESPTDPDARIAKMKDGRTHLAYKADSHGRPRQRADLERGSLPCRPSRPAHAGRQRDGSAGSSQRSGRGGDDRRSGGRQRVSCGRPDRTGGFLEPENVHSRAGAEGQAALD